jgi:hypothetical protein
MNASGAKAKTRTDAGNGAGACEKRLRFSDFLEGGNELTAGCAGGRARQQHDISRGRPEEQIVLISRVVLQTLAVSIVVISVSAGAAVDDPTVNVAILASQAAHARAPRAPAASFTSHIKASPRSAIPREVRAGLSAAPLASVRSSTAVYRRTDESQPADTDQREQSAADVWLKGLVVTTLVAYQLRRKHRFLRTHSFGE